MQNNLLYFWFHCIKLTDQYKALNPMQQVPAVEIDGITLSQSVSSHALCTLIHFSLKAPFNVPLDTVQIKCL